MPVEVKRTLVKSRPELWAEVSDPGTLARHLGPFGSIRITRAEAETVVDWEGERAIGSVRLEPSGFGTRVTLTAGLRDAGPPEPAPVAAATAAAPIAPFWTRLFRRGRFESPAALPVRAGGTDEARVEAILTEVMDALGTAHHRPFSRV